MPLSQQDRSLSVSTPLGEDVLLLRAMSAAERLSTLFEYELDLISEDLDIQHDQLLGQPVTVRLELPNDEERFFNGIVNSFSHVGFDGAVALYVATLVPWTWFLTRTSDCRIFQEKTVPDIIKEIFREHGYTDFEERLSGDYRQWVYCVQYRETDFNFISRLMEQEGLYYYFTHEDGKHTLILSDSYSAHSAIAGYEEIPYYPPDETAMRERDHISDWSVVQAVRPGAFAYADYDFTAPRKNLQTLRSGPKSHELADLEIYDYPGDYTESGDGDNYARIRLEEMHTDYETVEAEGNARGLATGALFNLTNYRREDQNREYLIVSASYQLQSDAFGSGGEPVAGPVFQCSLTAIEAQTPFRPPRVTPKPMVQGPQTAIVVGKSGEEIWTEEYGRVKVQFHWDRYGKFDENSSCWVRVSHPWAGKGWGSVAIPRIGQEVIVDFLEGDPDQPIITGRVYNQDCMPPYALPGGAVVSGLKSNSTKGGAGYNEFVMDDTKGNEMVREHAQYNKDTTVENDRSTTVKSGNDALTVESGTRTVTIKGDSSHTVQAGARSVSVTGGDYTAVSTSAAANITGKTNVNIKGESVGVFVDGKGVGVGIKGEPMVTMEGTSQVVIDGASLVSIHSALVDVSDATIQLHGSTITLQCGGSKIEVDAGKIAMKSGSGELLLDAAGATLKGALIKIN